jgi:hypothetical protein
LKPIALISSTSARSSSLPLEARCLASIALVEDRPRVVGLAVEEERAAADAHLPQSEVAVDPVDLLTGLGVSQHHRRIDQVRGLGGPEEPGAILPVPQRRDGDVDLGRLPRRQRRGRAEHLVTERQRHLDRERPARRGGQRDLAADDRGGGVQVPGDVDEVVGRDQLEPHRLPDAGRPLVPDAVGLLAPVLLPAGLVERVRVVLGPDHEDVLPRTPIVAGRQRVGDVRGEGRLAADVLGDQLSVEPDRGAVVDGPEVHEDPAWVPAVAGEDVVRDDPAVPDDRVKLTSPHA